MKNIILFSLFVLIQNSVSAVNKYQIDEAKLEKQFSASENISEKLKQEFLNAVKLSVDTDYIRPSSGMNKHTQAAIAGSTALALTYCGAVTGGFLLVPFVLCVAALIPVHRFILGTGDEAIKIFFAYFCTASGCSVGLLTDVIFLWIDKDGEKYENCSKIIMWNE